MKIWKWMHCMLDWFERTNKPCSRELMDWIILADLTVMKEFLVIQAIEHDEYYYYYNTRTLRPQLFTHSISYSNICCHSVFKKKIYNSHRCYYYYYAIYLRQRKMLKPFLCNINYYDDLWPWGAGDEPFKLYCVQLLTVKERPSTDHYKKKKSYFCTKHLDIAIRIGVWSCAGGFQLTFWEDRISCCCMEIYN